MLEDMGGYLDVVRVPLRWTSAATIMQGGGWAEVLRQRNCWIHSDRSSAHVHVLVHARSGCLAIARLLDLMNQTVEISPVHIPPSLLQFFNSVSNSVLGSDPFRWMEN